MTNREQVLEALNQAFSRKYHSMAQYILDAHPYVPAGREASLREIEAIAASDRIQADRLAEIIEQLEAIPQVATFHQDVANLNYLSLDYLQKYLVQTMEKQLAGDEQSQKLCEETTIAKEIFGELTTTTRGQLERLKL